MKKIVAFLLTMALCMSLLSAAGFAAADSGPFDKLALLSALNMVPDTLDASNLDEPAARKTLAYALAALGNAGAYNEADIPMDDVDGTDGEYIFPAVLAGYISAYGTKFYPDRKVSASEAADAIINTISKALANGMALNESAAKELYTGVKVSNVSSLTNRELFKMLANALRVTVPKVTMSDNIFGTAGISVSYTDGKSVLAKRFEVSVYNGTMLSAAADACTANIQISKNVYKDNPELINVGDTRIFSAMPTINLNHYEHAPVKIWVDNDNTIIYAELQNDISIIYNYVYSLNGSSEKEDTFSASYMNYLYFTDDNRRYSIDPHFVLEYNGEVTDDPVHIIGNFTKCVISGTRIQYMEAWDLSEGGIVTSFRDNTITYSAGELSGQKIRDIDKYNTRILFVDSRSTDISELKANTYFAYYKSEAEDELIIVASEKVITGTMNSFNTDSVVISGNKYYTDTTVYFSTDGTNYGADDYKELLNKQVDAYFTYDGYVKYIRTSIGKPVEDSKFLAAVMKYLDKDIRDDNQDYDGLVLYTLEGGFERKVFDIAKKVKYKDGLTKEDLIYNQQDKYGDGIYLFRQNASGEITEISRAKELTGFSSATLSQNIRPAADATQYFITEAKATKADGTITTYNSVLYFDPETRYVIFTTDGSVCSAEDVNWGRLQQHRAMNGGVKIHFFVNEENSAKLRMVALCGELGNFEPNLADTGIVMSKNEMINPYNDDACYQIEVLGKTGMSEYYVKYEDGQALKKNMFIEFNGNVMLNDGYIKIISMNDMSGPMSTWNFTLTKYAGLFVGQVANVDGQLLFFKDGTAGTIHKSETYIILDHGVNTTKSRFELATKDKIISGNRCVYTLGDSIKTLIVEDIY